jgi:DNA-binding CsgD family transcriptional regulator
MPDYPGRRGEAVVARLEAARDAFAAASFRDAASLALEAAELARGEGHPDLLAEAALVVEAVPDASVSPSVERLCRDALGAAETGPGRATSRLHGQLAIALHHRERLNEADAAIDAGSRAADRDDDPLSSVLLLHARALAIAGSDDGRGLLAIAEDLLRSARRSGVARHELLGHSWRIEALLRTSGTAAAAQELDSLEVLAAASRDPLIVWNAELARAGLEHATGRFADAERHARAARVALPPTQRHQSEPLFVAQAMLIAIDRGTEPPEIDLARGATIGGTLVATAMMGRYDLEIGDRTQALAAFELVRDRVNEIGPDRRALPTIVAVAELAVAFDDRELAADLDRQLAPYGGQMIASSLGAVGPIDHVRGRLARIDGDLDRAVSLADAAATLAARRGFAPWHARARLAHADALAARGAPGDRPRAQASASLAAATARKLGMRRVLERADACVRELDPKTRLSPRELEVSALVADGASNREIAAALGLSERTVESHVEHILAKLSFHSRSQVAAWAAAQGIAVEPAARPPES